jgi:hypothetical protein
MKATQIYVYWRVKYGFYLRIQTEKKHKWNLLRYIHRFLRPKDTRIPNVQTSSLRGIYDFLCFEGYLPSKLHVKTLGYTVRDGSPAAISFLTIHT